MILHSYFRTKAKIPIDLATLRDFLFYDLKNALEKKEIKGAALDVFKNEPLEESGFYNLDNIILTPHIAASTDEAQIVVAEMVANQFVEFFNNNKIINSVT